MSIINKFAILVITVIIITCNQITCKVFSSINENRIINHDRHHHHQHHDASISSNHNDEYLTHSNLNGLNKYDRYLTSIILEGDILVRKICECKRSHMCMFHDRVKLTNKHRCQNGLVCCVTKSL